jgi:hypothetical protein
MKTKEKWDVQKNFSFWALKFKDSRDLKFSGPRPSDSVYTKVNLHVRA